MIVTFPGHVHLLFALVSSLRDSRMIKFYKLGGDIKGLLKEEKGIHTKKMYLVFMQCSKPKKRLAISIYSKRLVKDDLFTASM